MTIKVLVVDDSGFFRRRLCEIINGTGDLEVIGTAADGREAIEKARELKPDVITMDYEMPVMDGITAVREITRSLGIPVLMFSSLTYEGARVTLDALEAGAVDYLPKNFEDISRNSEEIQKVLHDRIVTVSRSKPRMRTAGSADVPTATVSARAVGKRPSLVIIGASTGGPMALQQLLVQIPAAFPVPILLVQHMPATFTRAFAERLDRLCQITVSEAIDGQHLEPGCAYLAPGGKQMLVESRHQGMVRIMPGDERLHYKPSLDVTFGSAANEFGGRVLAMVLTGMGSDGREGARMLRAQGARIWVQDEASCVIYGMPMAVSRAGLADEELSLDRLGPRLLEEIPS
ncbi:MAG: chemotaxis response regulator protein-glutamate methylesterase [Gammaproteobacteria bacterium]|nr:chemotaxis response regulator protein-glutamate methylesterase [Gammaproteobacteria bacterium]MDP2140860.1 chemotaxis response regulator protein-glutamate methylesterase [Gammaproteobacteria bacterium]MDP2349397.1 chemotaxis response regulator protein-glutamate methylesterase [Gammaproteobacteria bacterium]